MVIEIRDGDEVVFACYGDGNVTIKDDTSKLVSSIDLCGEASAYLKAWLSKKQSTVSTESVTHQCLQGS